MLLPLENNLLYRYGLIIVLVQLFNSLGKLNAIELPLELLQENVNAGKPVNFPLTDSASAIEVPPPAAAADIDEHMPANAVKEFDTTAIDANDYTEYDLSTPNEMPKWLQMQLQPEAQQPAKYHPSIAMLQPQHLQFGKHHHHHHQHHPHHDNQQLHNSFTSSTNASPLKRCSIEISSKIPGICQAMGSMGNACVSGDYIDVFNAACE